MVWLPIERSDSGGLEAVPETSGTVEYTVDETGAVVSPIVRMSIDNNYDSLLLSAVKKFQYQPATLEGKPVKYVKRLTITVSPTPQ